MSSSRRGALAFLLRIAAFAALLAGVGEIWFRTAMPACEMPFYYQDATYQIFRYDPSGPKEGVATVGRMTLRGGRWRVNNAGWNSAIDYLPAADRSLPLIALFGDSFSEGLFTDVDDHVDALLRELLGPACDVYSFSQSGYNLEQYVATSRYVASEYDPDLLVIFIDSGDVSESVLEMGASYPYFWRVSTADTTIKEVAPSDIYRQGVVTRLAKKSSIVNYLRRNAKVLLPDQQDDGAIEQPLGTGVGQDITLAADDAAEELMPIAGYLVGELCSQFPGTPIVFASHRDDRYLSIEDASDTALFADAFAVQAACVGRPQCWFLDLTISFSRDWAVHRHLFEAADGRHWNAYANRLVAQTLADYLIENNLTENMVNADVRSDDTASLR